VDEVDDWEGRLERRGFFALWWVSKGEIGDGRGSGVEGSELDERSIVEKFGAEGRGIWLGGWEVVG
jgi:hypothetical protein